MDAVPISAILPAYDRVEQTLRSIAKLSACQPPPAGILVHLDNGADFPLPAGVKVIRSSTNIGPGGARNLMIRQAACDWVASFDDDSYPENLDYFSNLSKVIERNPRAGILACSIRHGDPSHDSPSQTADLTVATFVGCGCVYRRDAFLATLGYLPLPVAYGMEEVDIALQMCAKGIDIVQTPDLKVFHDTDLAHHEDAHITSGAIKNQALLAWLRYPMSSLPYGALQWLNKIWDSIKRGRIKGAIRGCVGTPAWLLQHRMLRTPVAREHLVKFRKLLHAGHTSGLHTSGRAIGSPKPVAGIHD